MNTQSPSKKRSRSEVAELQALVEKLQNQGVCPNLKQLALTVGCSYDAVRKAMSSRGTSATLLRLIVDSAKSYCYSLDELFEIPVNIGFRPARHCQLRPYGYADLGALIDSFSYRGPGTAEYIFDPSLPYMFLSDPAVLQFNDYHACDTNALRWDLAEAARSHRNTIRDAPCLAQRRVYILESDWKNFLRSEGKYHSRMLRGEKLATLARISALMTKPASDRQGEAGVRLFVVKNSVMSEPRFVDRFDDIEAVLLTCDTSPRVLCGLGPQICWASRRDCDVAAYKELFDYMSDEDNSHELNISAIHRRIKRLNNN
jgi:hypothetical protein